MEKLKEYTLKPLGNDSGFGPNNTSYYYEDKKNNDLYIFDCGFSIFNQLRLYFDLRYYNNIFVCISHLHLDHAGSLSQLVLYMNTFGKKVNIISKCKNIKDFLTITGVEDKMYNLKEDYINDDISISVLKTTHDKTLDSYSFLIDIDDKKIIYTADTNTLDPYIPYFNNILEFYVDTNSKKTPNHLFIEDSYRYLKMLNERGCLVKLIHIDDKEALSKYIIEFETKEA